MNSFCTGGFCPLQRHKVDAATECAKSGTYAAKEDSGNALHSGIYIAPARRQVPLYRVTYCGGFARFCPVEKSSGGQIQLGKKIRVRKVTVGKIQFRRAAQLGCWLLVCVECRVAGKNLHDCFKLQTRRIL